MTPKVHEALVEVVSNDAANADYRLLHLAAPDHILDCKPGQFFQILCPETGAERPFLRRPMSIYGWDRAQGRLSFLYKVSGAGTRALAGLRPGDRIDVLGPLGRGFTLAPDWRRLLVLARGVGLATLAPLAAEAQRRGLALTAICSARTPELALSLDRFRAHGAEVRLVTDSDGTSDPARVRALIEDEIAGPGVDAVFTCGSRRLTSLLQEIAARHGLPGQIAMEQQMACGLGMCQCCVRPFRRDGRIVHDRVCREGPVFPLAEAIPEAAA
ncbi:dihydroorotate dehydrogenase electron transfer subunit [Mesobaculum littorinae]|uniref:Dihydroorotate dehydrogenase electron transfer subunit n=1 Tax=Mesobaculum littorinae TaxID=2486419 RepID=A0A438AFB1_9RHOB|nr:dihydroorotate dehydrogenase electron transfer subunit [Mesobaculum littorinae]RVV97391.1 dihydroorotate dehydrogenase electron transfer subunit [Mesobaculum littorinae]